MKEKKDKKPSGYWNYSTVKMEASKYHSRSEFKKGCGSAYNSALNNNWLIDFTWLHDTRLDWEKGADNVYMYLFIENNAVYVGRTIDLKGRDKAHIFDIKRDAVAKYAYQHNISVPEMKIIETGLTLEEGQEREDYWKEYYCNKGYTILNKAKTGKGIGFLGALGFGKWKFESVEAEAIKYNSRKEFQKGCSGVYKVARKNGWLDEWFGYKLNHWDYKSVEKLAHKCNSRKELQKLCPSAYNVALRNKWLDGWFGYKYKYWNYNSVKTEALKYNSRIDFKTNSFKAYRVARKNGWLDEWFGHKLKYWDYNSSRIEATKYKSRWEFQKGCRSAYRATLNHETKDGIKWIDIFFPKVKVSKANAK